MSVLEFLVSSLTHRTGAWPRRIAATAVCATFALALSNDGAEVRSHIKDIADIEGVRDNLLVGYGLVVGLNGSGDSLSNAAFTRQSLISMLERLGVNTRNETLKTNNVAAVMVTATLPPFARQGTRIDVSVAALGDAKSLFGGTLLVTLRWSVPTARSIRSPRARSPSAVSRLQTIPAA